MASFNTAFEAGNMSTSQRQAIITLIDKKDKDRLLLDNWRPISLLNTDVKILSKALAFRMKKVLPNIIHHNESGYVELEGTLVKPLELFMILWILQRVKARAAS